MPAGSFSKLKQALTSQPSPGSDQTTTGGQTSGPSAPAQPTPRRTAAAGGSSGLSKAEAQRNIQVSRYNTVSLNVQETPLNQVLQMLSIQGKRNIVPSPKVSGQVTANLYDVTFREALDAILQQNGAGYIEKGNFIYVYTLEELRKIKQRQREIEHEVFELDYITAADASKFVKPLLSEKGSISVSGEVGAGFQPSVGDGGANSFANIETMVVHDYPKNIKEIGKVLKNLDTKPKQVLVEATVLRVTLTDNMAFGVDLAVTGDFGLGSFAGSALDVVDGMISGQIQEEPGGAATTSVGGVQGADDDTAGLKVGVTTNNVSVFVRALDRITDVTTIANPKIMTLNRQRAEVLVGKKVAYLSTTTSSTSTTQTVKFLDTGTKLTLRPFVSSDGHIRMELKPQISQADLRQVGNTTLPDETTQELTTNVMVNDGQTVVLGGLFKEKTSVAREQVPGLGDIPIAGNAFKGRDDSVQREETVFLITPHIVKDRAIAEAGEAASDAVRQTQIGAREGLLPWSRSRMTAAHMRDALQHLEKGEKQKALWEADLALGLDPGMVEARRLKEKLTGQRIYTPERSLLEESVNVMIEDLRGQRPQPSTPVRPPQGPAQMQPMEPHDMRRGKEGGHPDSDDGESQDSSKKKQGTAQPSKGKAQTPSNRAASSKASRTSGYPQGGQIVVPANELFSDGSSSQPSDSNEKQRPRGRSGEKPTEDSDSRSAGKSDGEASREASAAAADADQSQPKTANHDDQSDAPKADSNRKPASKSPSVDAAVERYLWRLETAGLAQTNLTAIDTNSGSDQPVPAPDSAAKAQQEVASDETASDSDDAASEDADRDTSENKVSRRILERLSEQESSEPSDQ